MKHTISWPKSKENDVEKLQEIVLSFANREQNYKSKIKIFNEQIKSLRDKLFGRKTEKIHRDDGQLSLFDIPEPECPLLEEPEETTVASHIRKKRGRKPLPADLPRVDVEHDLTEEEKLCQRQCMHLQPD